MKIKYINIILTILLLLTFVEVFPQKEIPVAINGKIDLRNWDFKTDGNIRLKGEWEFYWNKLLTSGNFKDSLKPDIYLEVPKPWTNTEINGQFLSGTGYATYRLVILSDTTKKNVLMISFGEIMTSYKVWVNGVTLTELGKVGINADQNIPAARINVEKINLDSAINEIIIQVANFEHRSNSFVEAPLIGEEQNLDREVLTSITFDFIVFGFLLIMAFYHIGLFILRRKNKLALIFALFSLTASLRTLLTSNFLISIIFPSLTWNYIYFLSYSSYYAAFPLIILYIQKTFDEKKFLWFFNSLYVISVIFLLTLVLPSIIYTKVLIFYQLLSFISIIIALVLLVRYVYQRKRGALIFLVSVFLAALTQINDILFYNGVINTGTILTLGLFILILGQSLTLSRIFTSNFAKNEELTEEMDFKNKNLQSIVNERTEEVEFQKEILVSQNAKLEELNNQLRRYYVVIQQSPLTVLITDNKGIIEYVNPAFSELTKYSFEEVIGSKPKILNSGKTPGETYKSLRETLSQGKVWNGEFINKTKDGIEYIERDIISPVFDDNNNITNFLAIKENITDLRNKENLIEKQNKEIENLYNELQVVHNDILKALNYAKKLQYALIPDEAGLKILLKNYFLIYKPKDQVSGDFYFTKEVDNKLIFAVGDCTGHGIPGAFITILSISNLTDIIKWSLNFTPAQILEDLRLRIKSIFKTFGSETQDGLDIALCTFDNKTHILTFAGANSSVFIATNNEIIEYKGVRNPIGYYRKEKDFENISVDINSEDIIYLSSDGYFDQFQNNTNLKFGKKRFINLLKEINKLPLEKQKAKIETISENWQSTFPQIDDITVLGIKLL